MPALAAARPTAMSLYLSGVCLEEVSMARDFITSVLRRELPDVVATAALLTSELVTNALVHADEPNLTTDPAVPDRPRLRVPRPFHVTAELFPSELCVLVCGAGSRLPVTRPKACVGLAESGRGLDLVGSLARDWGTHGDVFSRTVWFVLDRDPAAAA